MNSHQLSLLLYYLASILVVVSIKEDKIGVEASSLGASYMEMENIFQESDKFSDLEATANYKTKANQNMFYRPPFPSPSYFQLGESIMQLQQQFQQNRPQSQYLPEQNDTGDDDSNKTENSENEEEKVDMIDVHFDYSDIDTMEGGINDGQDFEEFMEMIE